MAEQPKNLHLLSETVVQMREVKDHLPVPITQQTALRWCREGIRGVLLESFAIGNKRITSAEAIQRFLAATQQESLRFTSDSQKGTAQ